MKTNLFAIGSLFAIFFCSCGPSAQEISQDSARVDSLAMEQKISMQFEMEKSAIIDSIDEAVQSNAVIRDSMANSDNGNNNVQSIDPLGNKITWRFKGGRNFKITSLQFEGSKIASSKYNKGEEQIPMDTDLDVSVTITGDAKSEWFMVGTVNGKSIIYNGANLLNDTIPASGSQTLNVKCTW